MIVLMTVSTNLSVLSGAQLRHGVEEPQQSPVAVEGRHVEEQLPRLEGEQEGASGGNLGLELNRQYFPLD